MKAYERIAITVFALSFLLSLSGLSSAGEPRRPVVDSIFDFEKEAEISDLIHRPSEEVLERLKDTDFYLHEDLSHKAIFKAFRHRRSEGIALALNRVKSPPKSMIEGKMVTRADDFVLAKRILEVFPEESVKRLLEIYRQGDAVTRGNIVRASGNIAGGDPVKDLLVRALDDKTFCEEESHEAVGEPLRVCDVAYNQLVLRYGMKNVLRTIGPVHRIEVRDYHIDILKGRL